MSSRYLRNQDLIEQSKLDNITIIGAGGIGSALIKNAAIMGFKHIEVWDDDMLEEHNLSSTSWSEDFLNKPKVTAAYHTIKKLNKKCDLRAKNLRWEKGYPIGSKVFLTPDSMECRKLVYEEWLKNPAREWLIDMRMGALTYEIITVTRDDDYFMDSYVPSSEIADDPCTAKHTIFCGSLAASLGLSQAFNVLQDRPYYAYIWGSLGPVSLRRQHFVLPKIETTKVA